MRVFVVWLFWFFSQVYYVLNCVSVLCTFCRLPVFGPGPSGTASTSEAECSCWPCAGNAVKFHKKMKIFRRNNVCRNDWSSNRSKKYYISKCIHLDWCVKWHVMQDTPLLTHFVCLLGLKHNVWMGSILDLKSGIRVFDMEWLHYFVFASLVSSC